MRLVPFVNAAALVFLMLGWALRPTLQVPGCRGRRGRVQGMRFKGPGRTAETT